MLIGPKGQGHCGEMISDPGLSVLHQHPGLISSCYAQNTMWLPWWVPQIFRQTNVLAKFDSSSKIRKSPNEVNPNNKPSQIALYRLGYTRNGMIVVPQWLVG